LIDKERQAMASDNAEIHELRPGQEDKVAHIQDRWGRASSVRAELVREDEIQNRKTIGRIADVEARRVIPVLEQAALAAEGGQRLRAMAGFAGDQELELELGAVLRRLAVAADPPRLGSRR
jgi:hypothetical protein